MGNQALASRLAAAEARAMAAEVEVRRLTALYEPHAFMPEHQVPLQPDVTDDTDETFANSFLSFNLEVIRGVGPLAQEELLNTSAGDSKEDPTKLLSLGQFFE